MTSSSILFPCTHGHPGKQSLQEAPLGLGVHVRGQQLSSDTDEMSLEHFVENGHGNDTIDNVEKQAENMLIADYGLFVGWGPNPEPEYVAVVVLEEAGFGGQVAAPVIRRYFETIARQSCAFGKVDLAQP